MRSVSARAALALALAAPAVTAPAALASPPPPTPAPPPLPATVVTTPAPAVAPPVATPPLPVAMPGASTPPPAPAAPAPRVVPAPSVPATPGIPAAPGAAPTPADGDWARPAADRLAARGLWTAGDDLTRDATRRDLARALMVLSPGRSSAPLPTDVAGQDPAAGAIAAVVGQRWMTAPGGAFRPDAPVTARYATTTMLRALGLRPSMRGLARISAGGQRLTVPAGFPAAVLSRELGFRHNYPASQDRLERPDSAPMRAADLVGMADRVSGMSLYDRSRAARYADIALPAMTPAQRTVVEAAFAEVGMPYVWGGDWPTSTSPWGYQAQGGFDCSGLVWMAFKGAPQSSALGAGDSLLGRTADAMAFEAPDQRMDVTQTSPGDLVFFGDAGTRTPRGGISHVGIALGDGWMIHSSGSRAGVTITSLGTYWTSGQALARRPAVFGPPPLVSAERRRARR